jgi:hypothetical protein
MTWTPQMLQKSAELAEKGCSAQQIGNVIGKTRNSVISKLRKNDIKLLRGNYQNHHSSNVPIKPVSIQKLQKAFTELKIDFRAASHQPPEQIAPPDELYGITSILKARADQCRFIHGEARELTCCGAKTMIGRSWCQNHLLIVYQNVKI